MIGLPLEDLVVTGLGSHVRCPEEGDLAAAVAPWLKARKMLKFMGKQDRLAVIAAGQAVQQAGVPADWLARRTGIYLVVGYIPFEWDDLEPLARHSERYGEIDMDRFTTTGMDQVNPLLTFRCLPNMPAFHVSLNLGIQGPYFVSHPGPGQVYLAMEQAALALQREEIDVALVGAVADQDNFLVTTLRRGLDATRQPVDVASFFCLERLPAARARQASLRLTCREAGVDYMPAAEPTPYRESFRVADRDLVADLDGHLGPALLPLALSRLAEADTAVEGVHDLVARDGLRATSRWGRP